MSQLAVLLPTLDDPESGRNSIIMQEECCYSKTSQSVPALAIHAARQIASTLGKPVDTTFLRTNVNSDITTNKPAEHVAMVFSWAFGDDLEHLAEQCDILVANPSSSTRLVSELFPQAYVIPASDCFSVHEPLPTDTYQKFGSGYSSLVYQFASGCLWQCPFCVWNHVYKLRNADLCVDEINAWWHATGRPGPSKTPHVMLLGNEITGKPNWLEYVLQGMSPGITWHGDANVRNTTLDDLRLAKSHRCQWLCMGIETLSDRLLDALGKGHTVTDALRVFMWCQAVGIPYRFSLRQNIGETIEDLHATLATLTTMQDIGLRPQHITIGPMVQWPENPRWNATFQYGSKKYPRFVKPITVDKREWHELWTRIAAKCATIQR